MKGKRPEIISFSLFGSLTKGYAVTGSDFDIDAYLNFDADILEEFEATSKDRLKEDIQKFDKRLKEELHVEARQLKNIISTFLRKNQIRTDAEEGKTKKMHPLFLMSIGSGINEYRKIILDELEKKGEKGERSWKEIAENLIWFENTGFPPNLMETRRKLYPDTIAKAKKYFLREEPKLMANNTEKAK